MVLSLILVLIGGLLLCFLWLNDYFPRQDKSQEILSRISRTGAEGYKREGVEQYYYRGLGTFLEPSARHENEEIRRVVRGVAVDVVNFESHEDAQKQIEEASHTYMWEWRKEDILGHEVYTGYLLDLDRPAYSEAYLAWVEGDYYFQLIAIPAKFEDYSDKQFLYLAAREVAESILTH